MRKTTRFRWWAIGLLGLVLALFLALPAKAGNQAKNWLFMNADSFPPTAASALEQCLQAAALEEDDRLTPDKCLFLEKKLEAGECEEDLVEDGTSYHFLSMLRKGQPTVEAGPWVKTLGRDDDSALRCDLGGVIADFYVGQKRSCGNLAIRFKDEPTPPPVAQTVPPTVPMVPIKEEGSMIRIGRGVSMPTTVWSPGLQALMVANCGQVTYMPGLSPVLFRSDTTWVRSFGLIEETN